MTVLFESVLRVTLSGSVVIAAVLALRLLLKRVPKKYICLLWLLAVLRLLLPFEIESGLSLQPRLEEPQLNLQVQLPADNAFVAAPTEAVEADTVPTQVQTPAIPDENGEYPQNSSYLYKTGDGVITGHLTFGDVASWLWLAVAAGMLLYTALAWLRLRSRVRDAVILREGVWVSRRTESPFVMGFFRPRIYLTPDLSEKEMEYVLAHERCHIRRGDHWWKLLGFVTLAIHWFNPLVWLWYILLCRDLEMACDEAVVKHMEVGERKAYSAALLSCSAKGYTIAACPVAFGEVSVKSRIQNVLNYRKPKFWVILVAVVAIVGVAVCFLTVPPEQKLEGEPLNVEGGSRWGITASCAAPSATGIEFRFVQNDDSIPGELFYGQEYTLEKWDCNDWVAVSPIIDNWAFTAEAILLPKNTTTVVDIDWEWLYGEVSDGYYRLSKTVWLNTEKEAFHVYFGIGEDYESWSGTESSEEEDEKINEEEILAAVSGRSFTIIRNITPDALSSAAYYHEINYTTENGSDATMEGTGKLGEAEIEKLLKLLKTIPEDGFVVTELDSSLTYDTIRLGFPVKDGFSVSLLDAAHGVLVVIRYYNDGSDDVLKICMTDDLDAGEREYLDAVWIWTVEDDALITNMKELMAQYPVS